MRIKRPFISVLLGLLLTVSLLTPGQAIAAQPSHDLQMAVQRCKYYANITLWCIQGNLEFEDCQAGILGFYCLCVNPASPVCGFVQLRTLPPQQAFDDFINENYPDILEQSLIQSSRISGE